MISEGRKKAFTFRVMAWREICDSFGSWGKAAKFFGVKKHELMRMCLDDLETTLGEKIDWEKAFK